MEEVYSSDDTASSAALSEPSQLITDEEFSDALFHNCDVMKTGKVEVASLIELLRFSTDQKPEVQNEIGELAKLLNPDNKNMEIDIEAYRLVMADWIHRIKSESDTDDLDSEENTPLITLAKTSTPKKEAPILNMMDYLEGAGDSHSASNELREEIKDLQFQNQRLMKEVSTLRSYLEGTEESLASKASFIDSLNRKLHIVQNDSAKLKVVEAELMDVKLQLSAAESATHQARAELKQSQRDKTCSLQQLAQAEKEMTQTSAKLEEKRVANNNLLQNMQLEKIKYQCLQEKICILEKEQTEDRTKIEELLVTVDDVNKINEKLKTERSELKMQLSEARSSLDMSLLQAKLGANIIEGSEEAGNSLLLDVDPFNTTPSIASELRSELGSSPEMPLPLCGKDYPELFANGDINHIHTSSNQQNLSQMDLQLASIMKSTENIAKLPINIEQMVNYMETRKKEVLERMNNFTQPVATDDELSHTHAKYQEELVKFAEKVAALYTAKLVSDKKLAKLTDQLTDLEERHQKSLAEVEASSCALQAALQSKVARLETEKAKFEETVNTLVRRCCTVTDLLSERDKLLEKVRRLESANAELTEKNRKAADLMNDSDDEVDKSKKGRKDAQKAQTTFEEMASANSIREQISMEIQTLRSQLARSQATLAALQSKGLPLTRKSHSQDAASWKHDQNNQRHSPSSPLIDALTLDLSDVLPTTGNGKVSRSRKEGCISADSILDGHQPGDYDGNGNLEYDQGKLLANSCPHLTSQRAGLVTSGTQTDCPEYVKPRPPAIGATKYAVVNTSTGSSTSGVVDLDISSGSNKSEPHGVIKKSVLIVETACSPGALPSSPEDPYYDPLCRYRTSSFKRAIERGASGDSSNQSFETADPASTSPDLTPDRPYLPPFPTVPGARDCCHLQPPPYREPSPDSKYSGLGSHHHHHHHHPHPHPHSGGHTSVHHSANINTTGTGTATSNHRSHHHQFGDTLNISSASASSRENTSGTSSSGPGARDTSTDLSWSSKDQSSESEPPHHPTHHRKLRSIAPENFCIEIQEASPTAATSTDPTTSTDSTTNTQDGRQSPQFLRRLSTLVEEGSDAGAEESLLSPRMRSSSSSLAAASILHQSGRRPPRLLDVPCATTAPTTGGGGGGGGGAGGGGGGGTAPPQYKEPPGYQQALQAKRDASPRTEHRSSPALESTVYKPLDQAEVTSASHAPQGILSPKAIKGDRSPLSPGALGMPCKRTIFPPPRSSTLSPTREGVEEKEKQEEEDGGNSNSRRGSRRGMFQDSRKSRDALYTVNKDGKAVDLVSDSLEEVDISEADKILNAQLLEDARKTSLESRHKTRRLRKATGSGRILLIVYT